MGFLRILLLAFNVAIVTYLIYRMLQIYRSNDLQKGWKIGIGIFLLLIPCDYGSRHYKAHPCLLAFVSSSNFPPPVPDT